MVVLAVVPLLPGSGDDVQENEPAVRTLEVYNRGEWVQADWSVVKRDTIFRLREPDGTVVDEGTESEISIALGAAEPLPVEQGSWQVNTKGFTTIDLFGHLDEAEMAGLLDEVEKLLVEKQKWEGRAALEEHIEEYTQIAGRVAVFKDGKRQPWVTSVNLRTHLMSWQDPTQQWVSGEWAEYVDVPFDYIEILPFLPSPFTNKRLVHFG